MTEVKNLRMSKERQNDRIQMTNRAVKVLPPGRHSFEIRYSGFFRHLNLDLTFRQVSVPPRLSGESCLAPAAGHFRVDPGP